jgi:uncharacterized protein (TIGR00369 family)
MKSEAQMSEALSPAPLPKDLTETLSGLAQLEALRDGQIAIPPMLALMNMHLLEVEKGRVVFGATPETRHYNPQGTVHGGFVATVLDSAMGCSALTLLPAKAGHTTLEFKISLVRPLFADSGQVRAEAWVVHGGRRILTAEGRLFTADGKVVAHGSTTCMAL